MTAWLGVAAFVVVVVELVAAGVGVMVARRAWQRVEPQVRPLLAMFAALPQATTGNAAGTEKVDLRPPGTGGPQLVDRDDAFAGRRCDFRGLDGEQCILPIGHAGLHERPVT